MQPQEEPPPLPVYFWERRFHIYFSFTQCYSCGLWSFSTSLKDHHSTDVHPLELLDLLPDLQNEYRKCSIYCHNPFLQCCIPSQYLAKYRYTIKLVYLEEILHINFKWTLNITILMIIGGKTKMYTYHKRWWIFPNSWIYSTIIMIYDLRGTHLFSQPFITWVLTLHFSQGKLS